jgi:hypothetical protein
MWFVVIPLNILLECSSGLLQVDPNYAYDVVSFKVSLLATQAYCINVNNTTTIDNLTSCTFELSD